MNGVNGTLLRGLQSSWQGMQGAAGRVALASAPQGDAGTGRAPTPSRLEADMVDLLAQRNAFQLQLAVFRRADEARQSLLNLRA